MVKVTILQITFVLLQLVDFLSATSWLYNAPRAIFNIASSASATASSLPQASSKFVVDFRKKNIKAAELEQDKNLKLDSLEANDNEEKMANEASPSLLRKKISKILTKFRLIAQIKNAHHYKSEDSQHETSTSINNEQTTTVESVKNRSSFVQEKSKYIQHIPPVSSYDTSNKETTEKPTTIELDISQIPDEQQHITEDPSRFGTLGVFFAELIGSLVGLTYGAVAQLGATGQNPVTISTSEGL
ncbi:hypothetical protein ABEB36_006633 [Hypothenemus hampei]|uniref:Uncharacterized protein n=1 Tax=Hypothenemus hampei TaxID=57062 RepID=A0ABD1ER84_HYPHA